MYSNVQFLLVLVLSSPKTKFQMKGFDHVMSVVRSSVRLSVSLYVNYSVFFFKTTESNLTELCSKHRYWKGTLKCLNKRQYIFLREIITKQWKQDVCLENHLLKNRCIIYAIIDQKMDKQCTSKIAKTVILGPILRLLDGFKSQYRSIQEKNVKEKKIRNTMLHLLFLTMYKHSHILISSYESYCDIFLLF